MQLRPAPRRQHEPLDPAGTGAREAGGGERVPEDARHSGRRRCRPSAWPTTNSPTQLGLAVCCGTLVHTAGALAVAGCADGGPFAALVAMGLPAVEAGTYQ